MEKIKLPKPISGGLILSYQCPAECRYCMYACSPKWRGWILKEDLEKILEQLAGKIAPSRYGPKGVELNCGLHFTGGEPFLNFELLLKAVEIANQLKIPSTFVETNCYWCIDDKGTKEKLKLLKEKGLKGILISVNPFYLEYVPFENTERGIKISQKVFGKEKVMIYQQWYYQLFKKLAIKGKVSFEDYLKLIGRKDLETRKEMFLWEMFFVEMFLTGRAAYKLKEFYPKYPPDYFFNQLCETPLIRDWHNHFDNYGNYLPGYCGGISLGDCRKLDRLLEEGVDLEKKPILRYLINQDFEGLFKFAKDFGYQEPPEGYISKCHFCVDLRKYLITKGEFEELRPKEFYFYLE